MALADDMGAEHIRWIRYSVEEDAALAETGPLVYRDSEAECPVCKNMSVRWYYYENPALSRIGISIVWCMNCQRFSSSSVVPLSEANVVEDPLQRTDLRELVERTSPVSVIRLLDKEWNKGCCRRESLLSISPARLGSVGDIDFNCENRVHRVSC